MSGLMTPAMSAFGMGFAIGFSLIMAIGAQNAFVLRQGLMRRHIFAVALFCAGSDALLIAAGVGGVSFFIAEFAARHFSPAVWLCRPVACGLWGFAIA